MAEAKCREAWDRTNAIVGAVVNSTKTSSDEPYRPKNPYRPEEVEKPAACDWDTFEKMATKAWRR
jgi:hypothetical protein